MFVLCSDKMLYDLLYYKCHTHGEKTGRYWGGLGPSGPVITCLLLNAIALSFVLQGLFQLEWVLVEHAVAFVVMGGGLTGGALWYYRRHARQILDRYDDKRWVTRLPLVLVVMTYYTLSFGLALLSAMYRNHDGVFK